MRSFYLLAFLALGFAARLQKSHIKALQRVVLQDTYDDCLEYLGINQQPLIACLQSPYLDTIPEPTPENGCKTNTSMYDTFCNDTCLDIIVSGAEETFTNSPACLNYWNAAYEPCSASDCDVDEYCYQGECLLTCTSKADCDDMDPCGIDSNVCMPIPGHTSVKVCTDNETYPDGSDMGPNIYSEIYGWQFTCSKNADGKYCSEYMDNSGPAWNFTCDEVEQWGCCGGTILQFLGYCEHVTVNNAPLYQCSNAQDTCAGIPEAETTCVALCTGDDAHPMNGFTGTCSSNITYHVGDECTQECKENYQLQNGTSLVRTCNGNGYLSVTTAVCSKDSGVASLSASFFLLISLIFVALFGM